jgi:hypothetical protein
MRNQVRILFALTVLICLLALLLMPGATTTMVVQSHSSGKQTIRFISLLSLLAMAAAVCRGIMRVPAITFGSFRQVYAHGFGPDLLDKTCVRLC